MAMFTRTVREYVPYTKKVDVEITEKRAPTDESVKVLMELEKEALNKVVSQVSTDNNVLSGTMAYVVEYCSLQDKILVKFKLNNKEYIFEFAVQPFKNQRDNVALFYEEFSKFLSQNVVAEAIKNVDQSFWRDFKCRIKE